MLGVFNFRLSSLTASFFFLHMLFHSMTAMVAAADEDLSWVLFDRKQFDGNIALDTKGDVQLFWKRGDEYSTYGIASRSKGYLALGFSDTGSMTGADIAFGYKNKDGKFVMENRYAAGFTTPEMSADQKNNMRFKEGDQKGGVTAFVFEKKNKADCFENQVEVSTDSWQWFIYAFSDENAMAKHKNDQKGKKYVKLGTGKTILVNEVREIKNAKNFTITQPEITLPADETTYCYTLHKLPPGKKNFLLGEKPVAASKFLHHLVFYACHGLPEEFKKMLDQKPDCNWVNFQNPCNGLVSEWAPGMEGRTLEPGFGKPFGSDSYEYVMMETHWNNPDGVKDHKDSAGYTFFYNDEPVKNEIGTLTLGQVQIKGWSLEPGKKIVSRTAVCPSDCTKRWPSDGLTAVSVFFHMHARGRNARVQVVRDGKEIAALSSIRNFEYENQFSKVIEEVKMLPGDRLITTCEWDTSEDKEPVQGGFSSQEEMCFAWIDYYPSHTVLACTDEKLVPTPENPTNGTAGVCLEAGKGHEAAFIPFDSPGEPFKELAASGNMCAASGTGAGSLGGTKTGSAPSATKSSSSIALSLNRSVLAVAATLALTIITMI